MGPLVFGPAGSSVQLLMACKSTCSSCRQLLKVGMNLLSLL